MTHSRLFVLWAVATLTCHAAEPYKGKRARLKGLVFEVEDWSTPKDAWQKDKRSPRKWCLWTTEQDVFSKRSMGASLQSPAINEDRKTPEDGAPPLHTHITGIPNGVYMVYLGNSSRTITLSLDGKTWKPFRPGGFEIVLGQVEITDGAFDLWADDRYMQPGNPGSTYYDYIRFEKAAAPKFSDFAVHRLPDGRTQVSWISSIPVAIEKVLFGKNGNLNREVAMPAKVLRNHRAVLGRLDDGARYQVRPVIAWLVGSRPSDAKFEFAAPRRPTGETQAQTIQLKVVEPTPTGRKRWPVAAGIPFAKGKLWSALDCTVNRALSQCKAMGYWPDGSIKWLGVAFLADTSPDTPAAYDLVASPRPFSVETDIIVRQGPDQLTLSNGKLRLVVDKRKFGLFDRVYCNLNNDHRFTEDERMTSAPLGGNGRIVMPDGAWFTLGKPDSVDVVERGQARGVVVVKGSYFSKDGRPRFRYRVRYTLYAHDDALYVDYTVANNSAKEAVTPVQSVDLRLPIQTNGPIEGSINAAAFRRVEGKQVLSILQDEDNHFTLDIAGKKTEGARALGIASVRARDKAISVAVRNFWETWPKGLAVKKDGLHIRLLPHLPENAYADVKRPMDVIRLYYWCKGGKYLLRRGMQYTASLAVRFGKDPAGKAFAAHVQHPLVAQAEPAAYCESGAFGRVDAAEPGVFPVFEEWMRRGFDQLEAQRRRNREYGWMNYGDWFGERKFNWGNSEYDLAWCAALAFARTGELRWLWRGDEMAHHYTDVDTQYRWEGAQQIAYAAYAHSVGHVGGFFDLKDPRFAKGSYGMAHGAYFMRGAANLGGHCVEQGQIMMGLLMGERDYLDAALGICGRIARDTTVNFRFGIERAAGWPLINVMAAYEATGNPYYLNGAKLILEKVYKLQDPDTGGWRMRQGWPECNCPDQPHIGGKTFATGILLRGLVMYDQSAPDPKVEHCIVRACDWLMNHAWCEEAFGFKYKTGCPKFAHRGGLGSSAALVAEGLAYASELTGDSKYRNFMLRWIGNVMRSRSSFGKTCSMLWRQTAYPLYYLKRAGIAKLPPAYTQAALSAPKRVLLDQAGRGKLTVVVYPGSDASAPFELRTLADAGSVKIVPATLRLALPPGKSAVAEVRVAAPAGIGPQTLHVELLRAGRRVAMRTAQLLPRPKPERFRIGDKVGFAGPADSETLAALKAAGVAPEVLPALGKADLNGFRTILVGRDSLQEAGLELGARFYRLADFARSGGALVLFQINDTDWEPGFLPGALTFVEPKARSGKIAQPDHPLFNRPHRIASLAGLECYDTVAHAGKEWAVLLRDDAGRPAILETKVGAGRVLVIEPNVDQAAADDTNRPQGMAPDTAKHFMENVAAYCGAE